MRTVSYRLGDLARATINIGKVAENEYTRVQFNAEQIFAEYPAATAALSVINPAGTAYPAVVTREGDLIIWDVTDADLTAAGMGELQLTLTENGVVIKSYIARTRIERSIVASGSTPDPVQNWLDNAAEVLEEVQDAIPAGGNQGQVMGKLSDYDYDIGWIDQTGGGGGGGTSNYNELSNKPQIAGTTLSGNKSLEQLGIASADAVSAKYTKPASGIPASDLASGVIPDVSGFYTKPANGIPASDIADGVIPDVSGLYTKPSGGIPKSDLASGVQTSLGKADTAYQKPSGGVPASDMASAVQTSLGKADSAYQKPGSGIPASDIASGVIPVLTDLIDDTAGDGDTNKVWSADKSAEEVGTLSSAIAQIQEDIPGAVDDWLDEHPEATTTVQDGAISEVKLDASLDTKVNEAYSFDEITVTQTAEGWRLNESDGLCASNASYKMLKYAVVQGQRVKVVTDDRFQFQNKVQVPSTGTSNRVGDTYSAGTYELTVPEGATYLIVSTLKTGGTGVAYLITNRIDEALNGISGKADRGIVNMFDNTVTINEGKYLGTTCDTVNLVPTGLSTNSGYDTPDVIFPVTPSSYVAVPKNFYGVVGIFNNNGTRQQIKDESALTVGKNCLYIATLSNTKYVAVSFNKSWYPNYADEFIIADATTELPEEYIPHGTTFVKGSKVLVKDVIGLPGFITDQNTKMTFAMDSFNEAYASRVQEKQTANSLTISFLTDTHTDLALDTVNTDKSITRALEVGYVGDYLGQDMIIHGGDLLTFGYQTKETPIHNLRGFLNRCYKFAKAPFIVAKGNHDDACFDTQITVNNYNVSSLIMPQEWNAIAMQYAKKCAVCPSSGNANYCYIDNERTKIRVFVLDSEDFDYKVNDGVAKYTSGGTCAFSNEQLNFVANALLFADKEEPSEWAALFVSHRPMDTTTTSRKRFGNGDILIRNHNVMLNIIRAYQSGTAYSDSGYGGESQTEIDSHDFPYDVDIDYTSKGAGEVIAFLCGHTHVCNTSDEVGANSSALSYGFRFVCCGSVSFYTLVFNRDTKKINVFFYKSDKDDVQLVSSTGEGAIIGLTASDLDQYGDWETSWT